MADEPVVLCLRSLFSFPIVVYIGKMCHLFGLRFQGRVAGIYGAGSWEY